MIAATTPLNLRAELERLGAAWQREGAQAPCFEYAPPPDHDPLRRALDMLAGTLEREGELGELYAARARELSDEALVCSAAGGPELREHARRRFARRDRFDADADALAEKWLTAPPVDRTDDDPPDNPLSRSDDESDPYSLLSRFWQEIGARRLPLRVVVMRNLSPLAAMGDGTIQVTAQKWLDRRDTERTVLHEIEGHAMPWTRAKTLPLGIFAFGTARGSDDQEGRALFIEHRCGFLDSRRRRELALRHGAARSIEEGADFASTAQWLLGRGAPLQDALRIAARVQRGGGLGREVVYLPAFLRIESALRSDPGMDTVLGSGRVSVNATPMLREWIHPNFGGPQGA
jgi:hypothetical protein